MRTATYRDGRAGLAELLEVLDGVACMDLHKLAEAVAPPPLNDRGRVDGRTRAGRRWHEQMCELIYAACQLEQGGLAETVIESDGSRPFEIGITDAGRRYLAEMRSL
jgi:hypothetical protein